MDAHSALPYSRSGFVLPDTNFAIPPAARPPRVEPPAGNVDVPFAELVFRQLRTPREIAQISHLREAIQLPDAVLSDPGFAVREKKETSRGWWVRSSAGAGLSEPSASFL
ncbi:hypothetical protein [Caenimonas soli]|uniref:hypothetical protein n=1 Tax=Caenimonas soli TaxID=2735555 RepID=UPI001551AD57|nr:hypothetical protein [Caenimonas soli]NPC54211.1 hypothetical protein [Caenimonas soli]